MLLNAPKVSHQKISNILQQNLKKNEEFLSNFTVSKKFLKQAKPEKKDNNLKKELI